MPCPLSSTHIPVTVIGGYLGAGKTTLVNHLLRNADGIRFAVLVNEFGALPIDADLIKARDGNVISITGGCVCCSYGDNLVATMMEISEMVPRPQHILIEASGVALPASMISTIRLIESVSVADIVVIADAETVLTRSADRYVGETLRLQLASADIIVVNKMDLISRDDLKKVLKYLVLIAPDAQILTTSHGVIPVAAILQSCIVRNLPRFSPVDHADVFETSLLKFDAPVEPISLAQSLAESDIVRAKGFVAAENGELKTIQVVGGRWTLSDAPSGVQIGIVCIRPKPGFSRRQEDCE